MKRTTIVALALLVPASVQAQTPDHRGEVVLDRPVYQGEKASAPIPPSQHVRNEGGSDRAGLCVISSVLANGMYQKVPDLNLRGNDGQAGKGSLLWRTAKARPGGYSPEKLKALVQEVMPGEKYASYVGTGSPQDQANLERLSRAGYPIGATMNTGSLYNYAPIHHMISLVHYRKDGWACVVDNNRPGHYSWMPASEFNRRWPDMGMAWMWIWTRLPPLPTRAQGLQIGFFLLAIAIVIVAEVRRRAAREARDEDEEFDPCFLP